jgi:3-oxoacyl-[acyl-carrier protein] reductase
VKTVLITGSSRGIGRDLAKGFARAGYAVGINFVQDKESAQVLADELKQAAVFQADVRDSKQATDMIDAVAKRWGRLDVLVNNAGITRDRTILRMSDEEWRDVVDVNLNGAFWCLRAAAQVMRCQNNGAIINVGSIMGLRGGFGNANYSASKAGLIALTKSAARELGPFQIRVNAILPGFHQTAMSSTLSDERRQKVIAEHPLGHSTRPEDLAAMVVSIAENSSISGQVFNVDSRIVG